MYSPKEDSYFLSECLTKFVEKPNQQKVLEIGCGSGVQLQTLEKIGVKKKEIFGIDIDKSALNHCKKLGFNVVYSDLFENINDKFDLIIFNPPYLPEDKFDKKKDTTGGKNGSETINEFLKQAKNHLNKNGKIIILTSSFTKKINWENYKKQLLGKKKLFFEKLYVWELTV
jgi:release factor glutamine methyltransferase